MQRIAIRGDTKNPYIMKGVFFGRYMRVYYFTQLEYALSNIERKRIKISTYQECNDPWELCGVYFDTRNEMVPAKTKTKMSNGYGFISFSKSMANPVMWAHYAKKFTGICLGFDVPDVYDLIMPMEYFDKPLKYSRLDREIAQQWLKVKGKHWNYEEELRLHVSLEHDTKENDMYFYYFDEKLILKEFILGINTKLENEKIRQLKQIIQKDYNNAVELLNSEQDTSHFKVLKKSL